VEGGGRGYHGISPVATWAKPVLNTLAGDLCYRSFCFEIWIKGEEGNEVFMYLGRQEF
jgi:hypothetical protein